MTSGCATLGWYSKNGSKWQTMPELMLRYRAATFFGRLYAPDILMGMKAEEELKDNGEQKEQAFIHMGTGEVLKPI